MHRRSQRSDLQRLRSLYTFFLCIDILRELILDSLDTFPHLVVNGAVTPAWANVRKTNNFNTQAPVRWFNRLYGILCSNHVAQVTDVKSADFRCYTSATGATATTINVAAGSQLGIQSNDNIYHAGVRLLHRADNHIVQSCLLHRLSIFTWHGHPTETLQLSTVTAMSGSRCVMKFFL